MKQGDSIANGPDLPSDADRSRVQLRQSRQGSLLEALFPSGMRPASAGGASLGFQLACRAGFKRNKPGMAPLHCINWPADRCTIVDGGSGRRRCGSRADGLALYGCPFNDGRKSMQAGGVSCAGALQQFLWWVRRLVRDVLKGEDRPW